MLWPKGRLQYSNLPNRHVIVLPKGSYVTELLVSGVHNQVLRAGVHDTLSQLCKKFLVLQGLQMVYKIFNKCIVWKRLNVRPLTQATPTVTGRPR